MSSIFSQEFYFLSYVRFVSKSRRCCNFDLLCLRKIIQLKLVFIILNSIQDYLCVIIKKSVFKLSIGFLLGRSDPLTILHLLDVVNILSWICYLRTVAIRFQRNPWDI